MSIIGWIFQKLHFGRDSGHCIWWNEMIVFWRGATVVMQQGLVVVLTRDSAHAEEWTIQLNALLIIKQYPRSLRTSQRKWESAWTLALRFICVHIDVYLCYVNTLWIILIMRDKKKKNRILIFVFFLASDNHNWDNRDSWMYSLWASIWSRCHQGHSPHQLTGWFLGNWKAFQSPTPFLPHFEE